MRLGDAVAFAQIGIVGLDGQIELEALRLYGLPEAAPALLCGTPTLPSGSASSRWWATKLQYCGRARPGHWDGTRMLGAPADAA